MSTTNNEPTKGTQAYCITCNTFFKNTKGAMKHIIDNYLHKVHYIDATDPKSRKAYLSMGLSQAVVDLIHKEQMKATKQ